MTIVIVGAGITGLATAFFLRHGLDAGDPAPATDVVVLDAAERPGGKIRTVAFDGARVDVGADAYLARRPAADALARRLGLGAELVAPATGQVWLASGGTLRPLPPATVLGVPTDVRALACTRVLTPLEVARVAAERWRRMPPLAQDLDVASAVGGRLGPAVVDRLVEPLLGGVYAGRTDRLSVQATMPPVAAALARGGSLVRALQRRRAASPVGGGPVFRTVAGGLGRLIDALVGALPPGSLRLGSNVTAVHADGEGWTLTTSDGEIHAEQVVVTVPAASAARVLAAAPAAAAELARLRTASVAVVSLALPAAAGRRLPAGSGLLVPRSEGRLLKAVTFSSAKWPQHAGRQRFLLRASVGRIDDRRALDLDDDALADRVGDELSATVGMPLSPAFRRVTRWEAALPQYDVGHLAWVARVRSLAAAAGDGLHLAGGSYDGVGVAPCVQQARATARVVLRRAG